MLVVKNTRLSENTAKWYDKTVVQHAGCEAAPARPAHLGDAVVHAGLAVVPAGLGLGAGLGVLGPPLLQGL